MTSQGYHAQSWIKTNPEIMRAIRVGGFWTRFSVLLFMVIAFFGITSIMNLMVAEKTREIGMLMAMGATRREVMKSFLLENLLIGMPAGILGCLLGFASARLLTLLPLDVTSAEGGAGMIIVARPEYFLYAMIFALALNLISGIYPTYAAARLDPVEAIGSEQDQRKVRRIWQPSMFS